MANSIDPSDPGLDELAAHLADPEVDKAEIMAAALFSLARTDEFVAELVEAEGGARCVRTDDEASTSRFEFGTANFVVSCVLDHVDRSIRAQVVPRSPGPIESRFEAYLAGESEPNVTTSASGVLDLSEASAGRTRLA